ncbi:hypothetical protein SAMD00019534_018690 [Acytostelium subglobosum LB1]|uniref:hypothetical protein n=1 Tax=Acytostelium subglobosum LB1 TaxID=1410327 RepID=UPI0006452201|nr:hypothetical protein SAMD00019534_018690 [Acytostelium subglobosum LB1]GAM18694.1 hypothetical protein SAMD00019534_018690 [Acytostelium subglobosum LB1]|eukprot:XP_012757914.1 hypothetical protein SAMD00019534_018690 [Acytostelium subglobosum LB1]
MSHHDKKTKRELEDDDDEVEKEVDEIVVTIHWNELGVNVRVANDQPERSTPQQLKATLVEHFKANNGTDRSNTGLAFTFRSNSDRTRCLVNMKELFPWTLYASQDEGVLVTVDGQVNLVHHEPVATILSISKMETERPDIDDITAGFFRFF